MFKIFCIINNPCAYIFPVDILVCQRFDCDSSWNQFRYVNRCEKYTNSQLLFKLSSHWVELFDDAVERVDLFVHVIS